MGKNPVPYLPTSIPSAATFPQNNSAGQITEVPEHFCLGPAAHAPCFVERIIQLADRVLAGGAA